MPRNDDLREAETSPDGRYVRFDEKLGNGAYKDVYLSYDTETGKEVAWNTVNLSRLPQTEIDRISSETDILGKLSHPHIITFYQVNRSNREEIHVIVIHILLLTHRLYFLLVCSGLA